MSDTPSHPIRLSDVVVLDESLVSAAVGEEMVVLHAKTSTYYDTDAIGADIWRRLAQPTIVQELCASLVERYEVDLATCERDVLAFLEQAHREGLVRVVI